MREFAKWRANEAIGWYEQRSGPARRNARTVRFAAIVFAAMAGVVPMISQFAPTTVPPSTATLALAVSGLLLALDKFFGFSSSWMRFTATGLKLRGMLSDFDLAWERQRAADTRPELRESDHVLRRLDALTKFVSSIDTVVQNETRAWMREFSGVLKATAEQSNASADPV
jgi:hypothetical protein